LTAASGVARAADTCRATPAFETPRGELLNGANVPRPPVAPPDAARRLLDVAAGHDRHRRIRLLQWVTAGGVYAAAALLMSTGIDDGWMRASDLMAWGGFVAAGLAFAYGALRSGWSERFADPALTQWQIAMGVIAVCWGYLICGPMRTIALFPLLLIFAFGAFALPGRRIAVLAAFASASLVVVTSLQALSTSPLRDAPPAATLPLDWINLAMSLVLLSALAVVAARLSALRANLNAKREALAHALDEVRRLATTDELTGLPNRRSMIERLAQRCDMPQGDPAPFCIAVIDIDHFKRINDSLGHAGGDAVLREFADRMRAALPPGDVPGRWGGEEFLVLMPGAGCEEAGRRLEALRQALRNVVAGAMPLTFSAGIACHRGGHELSALVQRADRAMYRAKNEGRDGIRLDD
jgi:diguanylate cyclase